MSAQTLYKSIKNNIDRFGSRLEVVILTDIGMDLDLGEEIQQEESSFVLGIVGHYSSSEIRDGIIDINDTKITIQSQSVVKKGDKIILDGITHNVINVQSLRMSGVILKYTLQVRS
ncbi:MAG: hypothetical protein KAH30_04505, partial [Caldisericia bacterium]|nr:hypothetical protein [Caldisericia bacterium]